MRTSPLIVTVLAAAVLAGCSRGTAGTSSTPPPSPKAGAGAAPPASPHASTAARLGIPPGHLPPPGQCRVWIPGRPPGHQAAARSCDGIAATAPAGAWIMYRPGKDRKHVHVRYLDERRAGVVVQIRVYEASSGKFVREEKP